MLWEETAFLSYGPLPHMALGHAELQHFCFHEMSLCSLLNIVNWIFYRSEEEPPHDQKLCPTFEIWFDLGKHCIWYPWLITETLFLMKIFMRAIWASPGVPTELQVCPWDPSFSTLVFHLWQCGGRRGVLGSDFMLKHSNTKSCFLKCCWCELLMNHFCSGWHLVQSWKRNFEPSQVIDGNGSHFLKHDDWLVFQMRLTLS